MCVRLTLSLRSYCLPLKMEALRRSDMSISTQSWQHVKPPQDFNIHQDRCDNPKVRVVRTLLVQVTCQHSSHFHQTYRPYAS